jgi:hypothetical protein
MGRASWAPALPIQRQSLRLRERLEAEYIHSGLDEPTTAFGVPSSKHDCSPSRGWRLRSAEVQRLLVHRFLRVRAGLRTLLFRPGPIGYA